MNLWLMTMIAVELFEFVYCVPTFVVMILTLDPDRNFGGVADYYYWEQE
jgi:hypothetical protein